jgi:hypothetical protein
MAPPADLAVEQLIAQARVEALDVAVLPTTAALDIGGLGADGGDPSLDGLGDELRPIIRPDVTGDAAQDIGSNRYSLVDRVRPHVCIANRESSGHSTADNGRLGHRIIPRPAEMRP